MPAEYGDESDGATNDDEIEQGGFTAEVIDPTHYHNEVHPERIVMLDGYALRLIEHGDATPKEMSLWVGFRQAVYQRWKQGSGTVKNVPYWEALRFSMMSKASYFRETSGKDSIAGGLVEVVPKAENYAATNDPRFDNAKRYRVHMAPRLTRRDCAVIESLLTKEICMVATNSEAREVALKTLNDLAERDPSEYLNQPLVETGKVWPRSVQEIVRRVLDVKGDMSDALHKASERVYNRIIHAFGKVVITHYFLRNAASEFGLTHSQAWAVIALHDRCLYDYETHTQKDFAVLTGGLDELGRWVGVDRKTVKRWLKTPGFSTFVKMTDMSQMDVPETWNARTTVFRIRQDEPLELDKVSHAAGQSEPRERTKCVTRSDKVSHC